MASPASCARVLSRPRTGLWLVLFLPVALVLAGSAQADALSVVEILRQGGCGGIVPRAAPLHHSASLDRIAQQWALGADLSVAAARSGYPQRATGVHASSAPSALLDVLRRAECRALTDRSRSEIGVFRRGADVWLVLTGESAAPQVPAGAPRHPAPEPVPSAASLGTPTAQLASRALALVNEARARGARCGRRTFAPAPPVRLSGTLDGVALGHAADMASHNYFEHEDLTGQTPADRVRAVGYQEQLVGENIAYGPASVEEAVQGWLDSPDHCENIMDPRFAEMGIASATGRTARRGLYWVQLLAEPRA